MARGPAGLRVQRVAAGETKSEQQLRPRPLGVAREHRRDRRTERRARRRAPPLARERRKTIVKVVGFYDIGAAWDSPRTVRLRVGKEEQDIKSNVGLGIRFVTPAFPIRLDWGYGFQHRPGEANYQINFGIGNLF